VPRSADLRAHPTTPNPDVTSIAAELDRTADDSLLVRFRLRGARARLAIPQPATPRMARDLWRHTCFEAFVALAGDAAYHEYNFSPSGEWAVHAFRGYRDGGFVEDESLRPAIHADVRGDGLDVEARFSLARLSSRHARLPVDVGLCAVVEASDGTLSYWAIRHLADRPDFHRREAFALHLETPEAG
jgi:hypothetical protein